MHDPQWTEWEQLQYTHGQPSIGISESYSLTQGSHHGSIGARHEKVLLGVGRRRPPPRDTCKPNSQKVRFRALDTFYEEEGTEYSPSEAKSKHSGSEQECLAAARPLRPKQLGRDSESRSHTKRNGSYDPRRVLPPTPPRTSPEIAPVKAVRAQESREDPVESFYHLLEESDDPLSGYK